MRTLKISLLVFILLISVSAQNFWQQSVFPSYYSGEILDIDAMENIVLASSYQDGLAISTDTGANWFATSPTGNFQPYSGVAITNSGYLFALGPGGYLYRSTDIGTDWTICTNIQFLNALNIVVSESGYLYIACFQGVYRSTDLGDTWTLQNSGLVIGGSSHYVKININSNGTLVATTSAGVFKSTNNAESWFPIRSIGAGNLAINSVGYVYADIYREDPYLSIDTLYRTTNNGVSWESLRLWRGLMIFINPLDDAVVLTDYNYYENYWLSTNHGVTWTSISTEKSPVCMSYNDNGNYFMGTYGVGIFKSNSLTGSWQPSNTGFPGSVTKVASIISNSGKLFAGTSSFGIFSSTDNGNSFTKISPIHTDKLAATSNGYMFTLSGAVGRSTDLGISWNWPQGGPLYDLSPAYGLCTKEYIVLAGGIRSMADAEIDRSIDNGNNWDEVYSYDGEFNSQEYAVIALSFSHNGSVLGCIQKRVNTNPPMPTWDYYYAILRSTYYGLTWTTSNYTYDKIKDFAWNYSDRVFAITSEGLLESIDNGINWNYTSGALPTLDLRNIAISYDDVIYIGTGNSGVIYSEDNGNSWNTLNQGMLDTVINSIYISPDGFLFAGTEHGGIFRSIDPITSIENPTEIIVKTYKLYQNYPNPFNPSTSLQYAIGSPANGTGRQFVTLKVYDLLGREVATLVNEEKPTGEYEVEFSAIGGSASGGNAYNLTSGIYFYQLKVGSFVETRKMVLLK